MKFPVICNTDGNKIDDRVDSALGVFRNDRALLVKLFYQNDNSAIVALRKFRTLKGMRKGPLTAINLQLMVEEDKTSNVQASTSVRLLAEALDLPRSTVQKIMRNILRYYPYKLLLLQELLPHDFETRHLFSLQFLARLEVDPEWPWNILWTDEAHFHLDGSVNTHNCRIWESDNLHSTLQVPLHSPKKRWGLIKNKSGRGRKSTLSDVAKRKVLKDIKIDPKLSAVKLAAETSRIMGRSVSAETVRNVIRHAVYSSRVARKKPFINLQNQKKRLEFAKTHQLKTFGRKLYLVTKVNSTFLEVMAIAPFGESRTPLWIQKIYVLQLSRSQYWNAHGHEFVVGVIFDYFPFYQASAPQRGCGSPVGKILDEGRHITSSSPVPLKTCRVGQRCSLNMSKAQTSSHWCGVKVKRGGVSSGVVHVI
ncbi:uncharacterized protein TNCV_308921 [Trichonephila clavipes]|nr:uncharacterized protein TNCV_308921 [Trichonephila clavipes]